MTFFRTGAHDYGKTEIDFILVDRTPGSETLTEVSATVQFVDGFADAYATGDNTPILPTGTMTNTVQALAPGYVGEPPEAFASALGQHFLEACPAAGTVVVTLAGRPWAQLRSGGDPDPTGFREAGPERWTVRSLHPRGAEASLTGGVEGLRLAKTTGASFTGFLRDGFTTTPDFHDRLMGARFAVSWHYAQGADHAAVRARARAALLEAFSAHTSLSGQQTLHVLAEAVLRTCPEVPRVDLECEANDHLLADLAAFGRKNPNSVYVAPRNPFSVVHLSVGR